ncbi:Hypp845 [Branchiostoma lanceolatum]|uniref:Hypp845 protein n=1 Tax=Branchiostoma lanceolatum TaxID=7740 RepID=A0A8J9W225_BRALA|nr:Hypp845 [Branchiostoma lanceolatum]
MGKQFRSPGKRAVEEPGSSASESPGAQDGRRGERTVTATGAEGTGDITATRAAARQLFGSGTVRKRSRMG